MKNISYIAFKDMPHYIKLLDDVFLCKKNAEEHLNYLFWNSSGGFSHWQYKAKNLISSVKTNCSLTHTIVVTLAKAIENLKVNYGFCIRCNSWKLLSLLDNNASASQPIVLLKSVDEWIMRDLFKLSVFPKTHIHNPKQEKMAKKNRGSSIELLIYWFKKWMT